MAIKEFYMISFPINILKLLFRLLFYYLFSFSFLFHHQVDGETHFYEKNIQKSPSKNFLEPLILANINGFEATGMCMTCTCGFKFG